jgi:hypothetical protein
MEKMRGVEYEMEMDGFVSAPDSAKSVVVPILPELFVQHEQFSVLSGPLEGILESYRIGGVMFDGDDNETGVRDAPYRLNATWRFIDLE